MLGRLVVIPYFPLSDAVMGKIVSLKLRRIEKRIKQQHRLPFTYDDDVVPFIVSRCTEVESGVSVL